MLLNKVIEANSIYIIIKFKKYFLADNILFNNNTVIYLVNLIKLFNFNTYMSASLNNTIKVNTLSIIIKGKGIYTFKGIFNILKRA